MRSVMRRIRKLALPVVLVPVVAVGVALGAFVLGGGQAGATTTACSAETPTAGTTTGSCSVTGTLTLNAGTLSLTPPAQLAWSGTLDGATLSLVDNTTADQSYTVGDNTGSGAGWHVQVAATTFTDSTTSASLSSSGTFSTNGSTSSSTATTGPSAACTSSGACTPPSNGTSYPVAITTAVSSPTPVTIFDAAAGSGLGDITISSVGWWLSIPPTATAGTYTSTVTFSITSGP